MGDEDDSSKTVVTIAVGSLVVITVTTYSAGVTAAAVFFGFLIALLTILKG